MKGNRKYKILFIPVALILLMRCAGFEPIVLNSSESRSNYSTELAPDGGGQNSIETPKLTDGIFEDFKRELAGWWTFGDVVKFSREKDDLKMEVNKNTSGYPQVGFNFQPWDFTGTPIIKIRMRADGDVPPRVRLDLRDVNEVQTNSILVMNDVELGQEFKDYYFDFNHKWKQSWPNSGIVDPKQISGMVFFICPGDKTFNGTIYIDEIYVMANKDGSGVVSQEYILDDLSGDINWWWGCDKEKVLLSKPDKSSLKVNFKNGQWACFGISFEPLSVTANPVIKMRIKVKSPEKINSVDIVPWFTDVNNRTTNKEHIAKKIVIGTDYTDFFFDYRGKLLSKDGPFNSDEINSVIVFVNTLGGPSFNGDIYLDEITFLPSVPAYVDKRIMLSTPTYIDPAWPKGTDKLFISDFKSDVANWKSDNEKISLNANDNGTLKISSQGSGPGWEYFTKNMEAIDFTNKPVLKLRIKAEGNTSPYLRVVLSDNFGNITNGRPAEEKIELKKDYIDYYFDFTGRFQQRFPQMAYVNPASIQKLTFYLNGGLEPFNGNLIIEKIQTVTVSEYLKVAR